MRLRRYEQRELEGEKKTKGIEKLKKKKRSGATMKPSSMRRETSVDAYISSSAIQGYRGFRLPISTVNG
jgi:hypothetical protein